MYYVFKISTSLSSNTHVFFYTINNRTKKEIDEIEEVERKYIYA